MKQYVVVFLALILFACNQTDTEGFSSIGHGVKIKRHVIGSGDYYPRALDHVLVKVIFPKTRSVPEEVVSRWQGIHEMQLGYEVKKGGIEYAITQLAEGDSATFLIPAESLADNQSGDAMVTVNILLLRTWSPQAYDQKLRELSGWEESLGKREAEELRKFIDAGYPQLDPEKEGYYLIQLQEGTGARPDTGDVVVLHYTGAFLDGTEFDNTRKAARPAEFTLGREGQMIRGMGLAVSKMREGEKVRIIVPSHLGFGKTGSSTGIIPPETTLIFEIELIRKE